MAFEYVYGMAIERPERNDARVRDLEVERTVERDDKGHMVLEARLYYLASEVAKLNDPDTTLGTTRGSCNLSKSAHGNVDCASFAMTTMK